MFSEDICPLLVSLTPYSISAYMMLLQELDLLLLFSDKLLYMAARQPIFGETKWQQDFGYDQVRGEERKKTQVSPCPVPSQSCFFSTVSISPPLMPVERAGTQLLCKKKGAEPDLSKGHMYCMVSLLLQAWLLYRHGLLFHSFLDF